MPLRPLAAASGKRQLPEKGAAAPGQSGFSSVPPVVLTIAGFDPSSGAGITADLKVFAAFGLYGVSAVTALTVQSTQGVLRSQTVDAGLLHETLLCLQQDLAFAGTKIGMLGSGENVATTADWLARQPVVREHRVLDPVFCSTSGRELLDGPGRTLLQDRLLPLTGWVTPNLDELAVLSGRPAGSREQMLAAAHQLADAYQLNVVATGGHLDSPDDLLVMPGGEAHWFPGERIVSRATHGTGCAFSSALLCRLVLGDDPVSAVAAAKQYVQEAIQASYPIGQGRGPMHHLYRLQVGGPKG